MSRELIVDAEWLDAVLLLCLDSFRDNPSPAELLGCGGKPCHADSCTDCLIAHSNGKVREYIEKGQVFEATEMYPDFDNTEG